MFQINVIFKSTFFSSLLFQIVNNQQKLGCFYLELFIFSSGNKFLFLVSGGPNHYVQVIERSKNIILNVERLNVLNKECLWGAAAWLVRDSAFSEFFFS